MRNFTRARLATAAALAVFALAACGGNKGTSDLLGGGDQSPSGGASPSISLPTGIPTNLPTGGAQGDLTQGTAHVEFSTGESADISLERGGVGGPAASVAFVDTSTGNTLSIGGILKEGDNTTSQTLALGATLAGDNGIPNGFASLGGECTIHVTTLTSDQLEGSFECNDVSSIIGQGNISATGTFEAST